MDRKIPLRRRESRAIAAVAVAIGLLWSSITERVFSQDRGGRRFQPPSPEEWFNRLDADGNGRLDPGEIGNNPFLPRMLGGVDTSRGLSREEFGSALQQARDRLQRDGFSGRGRGGDRSSADEGRETESRDDNRGRRSRFGRESENASSNSAATPAGTGNGAASPAATAKNTTRPRITIDLQDDLVPADLDGDGQLGLYEWRRITGRTLAEFLELDRNGDGFVTPREVAAARPQATPQPAPVASAAAPADSTASQGNPGPQTEASTANGRNAPITDQPNPATLAGDNPAAQRLIREADRFFGYLDKDEDGQIAPDEWEGNRIRGMFEENGIDLSQPISAADFVRYYVSLSEQAE